MKIWLLTVTFIFHIQAQAHPAACFQFFANEGRSIGAALGIDFLDTSVSFDFVKNPTHYSSLPTKVLPRYILSTAQRHNIILNTLLLLDVMTDEVFIRVFGFHPEDLKVETHYLEGLPSIESFDSTGAPISNLDNQQIGIAFSQLISTLKQTPPLDTIPYLEPIKQWREILKSSTRTHFSDMN